MACGKIRCRHRRTDILPEMYPAGVGDGLGHLAVVHHNETP